MLAELHTFSALVDLTVDSKKTFVWCNTAYHRANFRKQSLPIKKHARGLGAQLQFGKQHSTAVIRNRIEEIQPLWARLYQSLSPYHVKVMAIKQAAWSRCLHGIAATSISPDTFATLRTQAMRGLNATGAGCNSCVHLGMVESPLLDPYCWSIASRFRTVRECASRECLAVLLSEALHSSSKLPQTGLTSILVARIHQLGWRITSGVNCHDSLGEFSLLDVSFPELMLRLAWSWQKWVAASVSHRATFAGLSTCDPVATRDFVKSLSLTDQGLMRKALNVALFSNDSLCYFSDHGSNVCQFCGEVDSRLHRFWHCRVFANERVVSLPGFWAIFPSLPHSLVCHGWALRSQRWGEWKQCLLEIPKAVVGSWTRLGAPTSCQAGFAVATFADVWGTHLLLIAQNRADSETTDSARYWKVESEVLFGIWPQQMLKLSDITFLERADGLLLIRQFCRPTRKKQHLPILPWFFFAIAFQIDGQPPLNRLIHRKLFNLGSKMCIPKMQIYD